MRNRLFIVLALLLVLRPASADWTTVSEHWYVLDLNGSPAGSLHTTVQEDGERLRTVSVMQMKIDRGSVPIEIAMETAIVETTAGEPTNVHFTQNMAQMALDTRWTIEGDEISIVSTQGGRETSRTQERPEGQWLPPRAAARMWREAIERGAEHVSARVMMPDNGVKPVDVTAEFKEKGEITVDGRTIPTSTWAVQFSHMPGITSMQTLSTDGILIRDEIDVPFGTMVTRLVERGEAMAAAEGGGPELMVQTFVRPDKAIKRPRATKRIILGLSAKRNTLPDLPTAGVQSVEMSADGKTARVTNDLAVVQPASGDDEGDADYLDASAMINGDDELVGELTGRALKNAGEDKTERAEAMRKFVNRYINQKGLATAFATASETARTRAGDCSEHAVLLCALLRADDIPSRVATGLIYADRFAGERDIFGWHMWSQALIDGKWIDLDATLPVPYDATHILCSTSSLADGTGELSALMMMMGNLEIEVVEVDYSK